MSEQQPKSTFAGWMGSMWLYTTLRFALFGVLWAILYLLGLSVYVSALLGLVLSVPLSLVLLAKPRARFTAQIEQRVAARQVAQTDLAVELDPDAELDPVAELDQGPARDAADFDLMSGEAQRRKRR